MTKKKLLKLLVHSPRRPTVPAKGGRSSKRNANWPAGRSTPATAAGQFACPSPESNNSSPYFQKSTK